MSRFRITSTGLALFAGTVILYALGAGFGYASLVAIAVGGIALLVAGLVCVVLRPAVVLTRTVNPERITVGGQALGRLWVRNTSRWPSIGFTAVDRLGEETIDLPVSPLGAGAVREITYPLPGTRRGRLPLGPLTVERRDPLGLFVWAQRQTADAVLWVHPRVHPLPVLPVGIVLDYEGRASDNARLGTVTFSALREYVPGDDPRHIHWRSTARVGTLVVREHVDTTEPTTSVVLDTGFADADAFDEAVEMAASVVRAVEDLGRPVELHIVGEDLVAAHAAGAVSTLDRLALATPAAGDVAALLSTVSRAAGGGALVVITGGTDAALLVRLADQRRRFSPVVIASVAAEAVAGGARRRPGLALLSGNRSVELAAAWHRMVRGEGTS
jgi:uncharacterized protein (DUF58 family)